MINNANELLHNCSRLRPVIHLPQMQCVPRSCTSIKIIRSSVQFLSLVEMLDI